MSKNEKDNGIKPDNADSDIKGNDPCLRCGEPVENRYYRSMFASLLQTKSEQDEFPVHK